MGILTAEPVNFFKARQRADWLEYLTLAIFVVLTGITVFYHEPWADEGNSWLLGRDASLVELWTRLMHYEGTPGLWQTVVHILIRLGFPYSLFNASSGAIGCVAAWIFIRKAPMPLPVRLAMPFTFYLFYQYSVVARSYCLLPILLFSCAWLYPRAGDKPGMFTLLLCLMAGVSVHGMIISGAVWISFYWDAIRKWGTLSGSERKRLGVLAFSYTVVVLLLAWSAWPAKDVLFASKRDHSFEHLVEMTTDTVANAFTGEWISSLALVVLCLPFLWAGRGLMMFLIAGIGLCVFNAQVYANVWHEGMPFLAWLFAMWISGAAAKPRWISVCATIALVATIGVQGYWAFLTTRFDWQNPYSGSRQAARYIREHDLVKTGIYGIGFACVGIQPYFARNIFPNFRDGKPQGYFDWSAAYRNFAGEDDLATLKPEYVIVGYKDEAEKILTGKKIRKSGYVLVQHFDGNLFWHDDILEPDAFDLYRRSSS